jgi:DNA-binding MarR family transcriptional regulator
VQSSVDAAAAHRIAQQMMSLWHYCLSDTSQLYGLLEDLDLGLTDMKLLHHLAASPAPLTVKELAERMGLSLPGASRAADALVKRDWLTREEDAHDRRMKRLTITDAGRDVVRRVDEARLSGLEHVIADVPTADLDRLSEAIAPILSHLAERRSTT